MRPDVGARRADEPRAPFSKWLRAAAAHAGAADEFVLSRLLVEHGCYCTPPTVASWLAGTSEPSHEKARLLLGALNAVTGGFDVWEQYGRWKSGEPFFVDRPENKGKNGGEPTLDDVVEASGLPPPLTDP